MIDTLWLTRSAELEAETGGETLGDGQAVVEALWSETLAEVEAETLGDTLRDAQAPLHTLGEGGALVTMCRNTGQCEGTGRHIWLTRYEMLEAVTLGDSLGDAYVTERPAESTRLHRWRR